MATTEGELRSIIDLLKASLTTAEKDITELKKTQCCKDNCPHAGFWKD